MVKTFNNRILEAVRNMQQKDAELSSELETVRVTEKYLEEAKSIAPALNVFEPSLESLENIGAGEGMALETIVLRVGRPVLTVQNGAAILEFRDAESQVWKSRLENARDRLLGPTAAVGRVELQNHFQMDWVGTGWLVAEGLMVTNRHVAEVFAQSNGTRFIYRTGRDNRPLRAQIDFLEEANRPDEFTFELTDVLHIEKDGGPDLALIKVKPVSGRQMPEPIRISSSLGTVDGDVAVIGYPARDSRIPDQQLMIDIFGDVFNKKRLAPGQVTRSTAKELLHDCSTLGGNSGSVVLDLNSGEAVGLHFAGRFLETNYAVPGAVIINRIKKLKAGPITTNGHHNGENGNGNGHKKPDTGAAAPVQQYAPATRRNYRERVDSATFTIPINVTISVGDVTRASSGANGSATAALISAASTITSSAGVDEDEIITEARPEDYADREGYDADFLDVSVPLPQLKASKRKDILVPDGAEDPVLKYTHFSVLMSKSRRQCFYSAVNIDGKTSVGMKRGAWRTDPRIPEKAQIMKECYGNPPKFSRGHMTRREDPIWGKKAEARRGNDDSMHVTNTVPQMQGLNAGIWLGLENYALHNARQDDMRISVFTGPVFKSNDPVQYGVKIPLSFWKVIAFIHDETGELCATGYTISQKDFIETPEFVFGEYKTAQIPVARIETMTGLSFGELADLDPLNKETESLVESSIEDYEQIRFY
jgi:endonuclease G